MPAYLDWTLGVQNPKWHQALNHNHDYNALINKNVIQFYLTLADHKKGNSKWIFKFKSKNKEN